MHCNFKNTLATLFFVGSIINSDPLQSKRGWRFEPLWKVEMASIHHAAIHNILSMLENLSGDPECYAYVSNFEDLIYSSWIPIVCQLRLSDSGLLLLKHLVLKWFCSSYLSLISPGFFQVFCHRSNRNNATFNYRLIWDVVHF